MICPSCGKAASTYLRFLFSLQGVSIRESFKGNFKCQSCGVLLRYRPDNRSILWMTGIAVGSIAIYSLLSRQILDLVGIQIAYIMFLPFLLLIGCIGCYFIVWRNVRFEKAGNDIPTSNAST
jgi:hypothetical protein